MASEMFQGSEIVEEFPIVFFFETEVGQMEPAHEELFSGFWE
jgi:hypothetical protein